MVSIAPIALPVLLLFGFLAAGLMILYGLMSRLPGRRWGPFLVVPTAVGIAVIVALVVLFPEESIGLLPRLLGEGLATGDFRLPPSATWFAIAAAFLGAGAVVHFGASEIPGWGIRRRQPAGETRPGEAVEGGTRADIIRGVLLGLVGAGTVAASIVIAQTAAATTRQTGGASILSQLTLPGPPTGFALTADKAAAYVTLGDGSIVRVALGSDGRPGPEVKVVASGLSFPRGPAIVDGELFVSDLGTLACPNPYPQCWTPEPAEELKRINASSGSVVAFEIQADGTLGSRRDVLTDLPVVNTEHAPNSLTPGPDGYLYMPIAGPDRLPLDLALVPDITHPKADLLGKIVRFLPAGGEVEVVASGIRNIYGLAFDPDGRLYGADNDGQTGRGWRHEQLLQIVEGADYGYPANGTFDGAASAEPLWLLDGAGSSGIEWSATPGAVGVLVGSAGRVDLIRLQIDEQGPYVADERNADTVLQGLNGFVTGIRSLGDGRFLISILRLAGDSQLVLIELKA
jgi:hypothetical protein